MIWLMCFHMMGLAKCLPLKLNYLIGVAGGYLLYLMSSDKRQIMAEEVSSIFPDKHTN